MEETATEQNALIKEISMPLYQSKGWMKLIGVLSIVYGGLLALTIFGIIIAWVPIWMGIILYKSASTIEQAVHTGEKTYTLQSLQKLKTYFTIMGVVTLIGLIVGALAIFLSFLGLFGSLMEGINI